MSLGPVDGTSNSLGIASVTYDSDHVYITMANGDELRLPRLRNDLSGSLSLDPVAVRGNIATFSGLLDLVQEELPWSAVTVYYAQSTESFNIHNSLSVTSVLSDGAFSLSLFDLKYDSSYKYCIHVKVKSEEYYSEICEFRTDVFGAGHQVHLYYENGTFNGSGYFYQTVTSAIINGYGAPMLKTYVPERIDGLQFYIRAMQEGIQPLTAFIAYMTDHSKVSTFKIIHSQTNDIHLTKSYSKVVLPLEIDRDELADIPEDGVVYVGFYPPEPHAGQPIGIGYTGKTDSGYIETESMKGTYAYRNVSSGRYVWGLSSSKQPRYAGFITLVPES